MDSVIRSTRLEGWMHFVLKFAGCYNIVAGLTMIIFYHEAYKMIGVDKPDVNLPIQLVGMCVALFGMGYLIVDRQPLLNQNVLFIGLLSKAIGPLFACYYIFEGQLPVWMLFILFFADTIYLYPFWLTYKRIGSELDSMIEGDAK